MAFFIEELNKKPEENVIDILYNKGVNFLNSAKISDEDFFKTVINGG